MITTICQWLTLQRLDIGGHVSVCNTDWRVTWYTRRNVWVLEPPHTELLRRKLQVLYPLIHTVPIFSVICVSLIVCYNISAKIETECHMSMQRSPGELRVPACPVSCNKQSIISCQPPDYAAQSPGFLTSPNIDRNLQYPSRGIICQTHCTRKLQNSDSHRSTCIPLNGLPLARSYT